MSESQDVTEFNESEQNQENETVWKPVNQGEDEEYNDFDLAFVNVDKDTDEVTFNVDGDEVEPENVEGPVPMITGRFKGIEDISASDNPDPSIKILVESEKDERTYALNKVTALENQLEQVEKGSKVGLDFEGYVDPDGDGLPWQNWQVYQPS